MNNKELIVLKEKNWAKKNNKTLTVNNKNSKSFTYFKELNNNLFIPLSESLQKQFNKADGHEINDSSEKLAKMKAIHSSSALAVNIFHYWQTQNKILEIAYCCGLCNKNNKYVEDMFFEKNDLVIDSSFERKPNIDIVITNSDFSRFKAFAIESKFTEHFTSKNKQNLSQSYLDMDYLWKNIDFLRDFISQDNSPFHKYKYLDAAQLVKHILCLNREYGKGKFKLLYLYYDSIGEKAINHYCELLDFSMKLRTGGIEFRFKSYQELIYKMANNYYKEHVEYFDYIIDRYI
jgi:hypothetical protein